METYSFTFRTCVLFYMGCFHISSANITLTTPALTSSLNPESTTMNHTDTTYIDPITSDNLTSSTEPVTATLAGDQTTTATQTTEPVTSTFSGDQTTSGTQDAGFPRLILIVAAASASASVVIMGLVLVIICSTTTKHSDINYLQNVRQLPKRKDVSSTIYDELDAIEMQESTSDPTSNSIFHIYEPRKRNDVASVIYEAPDSKLCGYSGLGTHRADDASSSYSGLDQLTGKEADHDYYKLRLYESVTNEECL